MEDLPLTVTENDNGSFTFDWDDEHPITSQLNTWTENDFLNCLREQMEIPLEFSVEEFEKRFDELFERVEDGETFVIVRPDGKKVYILPMQQ